MKNNKNYSAGGGFGLAGVLTVVFVVLKLVGVINWNWWWVLAPLWISAIIVVALIVVVLTAAFLIDFRWNKGRRRDRWKR
jgi:heme/copper-type cytochrome/quinol oxidase subunit 2